MRPKVKALKPSIAARMASHLAAKQNELNGITEWIESLREMLKLTPQDPWIAGSLRYYLKRQKELRAQIDLMLKPTE